MREEQVKREREELERARDQKARSLNFNEAQTVFNDLLTRYAAIDMVSIVNILITYNNN